MIIFRKKTFDRSSWICTYFYCSSFHHFYLHNHHHHRKHTLAKGTYHFHSVSSPQHTSRVSLKTFSTNSFWWKYYLKYKQLMITTERKKKGQCSSPALESSATIHETDVNEFNSSAAYNPFRLFVLFCVIPVKAVKWSF